MSWKERATKVDSSWKDRAQPVIDLSEPKPEPESRPLEAAVEGLGQGASLGYGNELAAALEQVTFPVASAITGYDVKPDSYIEARDKYADRTKALEKENPGAYMAGQVGGGIASAIATSPLTAVKGATGLKRIADAAKIGGVTGLVSDTDGTRGEIDLDILNRLKNGAIGYGLGAGLQGAGEVVPKIPGYLKDKSADLAKNFAARALGAERGTVKSLGADKVKEVGQFALDNNLFTPFSSTDDIIARNNALIEKGGNQMGDVYKAIDDAGLSNFNPLDQAVSVENKIGDFYRSPINRGETNQLENTLESILMRGDGNIPLTEAQKLKQELGKVANWKNNLNITDKEKMARDAYGVVSSGIDKSVESGMSQLGDKALLKKLAEGKKLYGLGSDAEKLLENKQAREAGNKILGLTDWELAGGGLAGTVAGAATGGTGAILTAGALASKKLLEKYGPQNAALILNKISKTLSKSPQMAEFASTNPAAFQRMVSNIAEKINPSELPRAADKGNNEVSQGEQNQNKLIERIKQNPAVLDSIQDPKLKDVLKTKVRDSSIKDKVPIETAQSDFVNNN